MFLIPLVRLNRAITSCYILPLEPIKSIALSELISVLIPLFDNRIFAKMFGHIKAILYSPNFTLQFIKSYEKSEIYYYNSELIFLFCINLFLIYEYFK